MNEHASRPAPDGLAERFDAIGHGLHFQALFSGGLQLALLGRRVAWRLQFVARARVRPAR